MLATAFVSLFCNLFNLAALGHIPVPCLGEPLDDLNMKSTIQIDRESLTFSSLGSNDQHSLRPAAVEIESSQSSRTEEENLNVRAAVVHIIGDML